MKVAILGQEGYLGTALTQYLLDKGHYVCGIDTGLRKANVKSVGSDSLIPKKNVGSPSVSVSVKGDLEKWLQKEQPDTVVHFAEQPSAPFSMRNWKECEYTQRNNILGTLTLLWCIKELNPDIHIIKLGTMGVYGTPETDIPETSSPVAYDPGSFYHISKAADSINIRKACQWWGLRATDLHQGVVYGHEYDTRFDYDEYFGTIVNRFLVQSLAGNKLTVYGKGGQTRGFINIKNTLECIELAMNNPPDKGEYRVFNQITEIFSVSKIASMVSDFTGAKIEHIDNPRLEKEDHVYEVKHEGLLKLGLKPIYMKDTLEKIYETIEPYKKDIRKEVIMPTTKWQR